jgi:hypothetical protein
VTLDADVVRTRCAEIEQALERLPAFVRMDAKRF